MDPQKYFGSKRRQAKMITRRSDKGKHKISSDKNSLIKNKRTKIANPEEGSWDNRKQRKQLGKKFAA